ncbi:O-antigen ligase family protein [Nocardioides sp.]|uniref:O-antigen ligase family protein n=1 Tax=Nocardioides sp. TaxID=35761 RepID=UPI002B264EFA|nr:O-antigen ligase family protein [Nocardioides sp.]
MLTAGALAGAVLVARGGTDPLRLLGWFLTPLCVEGTVFSTSRGSMLGLALGLVLLAAMGFARRGHRLAGLRVVLLTALSWATTVFMAGPPVFTERASAIAGTSARSGTFVSNGTQRFEDWRRAWDIFCHWPVSGAGFNSYDAATTIASERRDGVTTAFAHNGFLQVMADGGLLLTVPVFTAVAVILLLGLRRLPSSLRAGEWTQPGALVIFFVLMLHSGMDFDWAYPSILALTAVAGAAALPPVGPDGDVPRRRALLLGGAAVALLVLAAVAGWDGGLGINADIAG